MTLRTPREEDAAAARWSLTVQADTIANMRDALRRASEAMATAAQPVIAAAYETVDRPDAAVFEISKVHADAIREQCRQELGRRMRADLNAKTFNGKWVWEPLELWQHWLKRLDPDVDTTNTERLGKTPE